MKCERYWGPAADGHWRKEIRHTTINCEHRATPLHPRPYPSSSSPGRPRPLQPGQQASRCWCQASGEHTQGRQPQSCSCLHLTSSPPSLFTSASTSIHPFTSSINPRNNSLFLLHTFFCFFLRMLPKSSVQTFFHFSALYCCSTAQRIIHNLWWCFMSSAFKYIYIYITHQGLFGALIFYDVQMRLSLSISERTQGCFIYLASAADVHKVRAFKNTSCYSNSQIALSFMISLWAICPWTPHGLL